MNAFLLLMWYNRAGSRCVMHDEAINVKDKIVPDNPGDPAGPGGPADPGGPGTPTVDKPARKL